MSIARVLVIAGSDSGGGAGIQADIKTITMLGGHAMTAITAITAQNTLGVQAVMPVPTEMVLEQMRSCLDDIGVDAVKIGMIGSAETANAVADMLEGLDVPIVFDPVMVATSGSVLADAATITAFGRLIGLATVTTPNVTELAALGGEAAVRASGSPVLVKGGHGDRGGAVTDRLGNTAWTNPRIDTRHTHGTGCTLASAIATGLAQGMTLEASVGQGIRFVRMAMLEAPGLGNGHGPMGHGRVRLDATMPGAMLNQVTLPLTDYAASFAFYQTLGLTPIVATDDAHYARFEAPGGATLSIEAGAVPTVFLECAVLDAEVARLQGLGVTFDTLPTDQDWLWREARLTDPAGNALCLYQAGENRRFPSWRLS